jgi:DNA-binding CsgD family transcriptional regulator
MYPFCIFSQAETTSRSLKTLIEIENRLTQNPVTAKQDLWALIENSNGISDSVLGCAYVALSKTMGMTNSLDSGIWAAKESIRLLPDESLNKGNALKTLAILYRLKGDWEKAKQAHELSIALNDRFWKNKEMKVLTMQEYGNLYSDQHDFYSATELYIEALKICESADFKARNKPYTITKLRVTLAETYSLSKNYTFAIRELKTALFFLDSVQDTDGYIRSGIHLADAYIKTGQIGQADSLINLMIAKSSIYQNEELNSYLLMLSGEARSAEQKFGESVPFYRSAFKLMDKNNSPLLLECANAYLQALEKTGNQTEARQLLDNPNLKNLEVSGMAAERLAFKKLKLPLIRSDLSAEELYQYTMDLIRLQEAVALEHEAESAKQLQAKYQFEQQQKMETLLLRENDFLRQKEQYKTNQLYLIVVAGLLAVLLLAVLIWRLRQRGIEKDRRIKAAETELHFQRKSQEWAEKEKHLRDQLFQQQKTELVRSLEYGEHLKSQLEKLVEEQQVERRKELLEQLNNTQAEKIGLEYLLSQFNASYPSFSAALIRRYPKLSPSDLQFCSLYRINLGTKEIAVLLHIEPRSVYIKKYRLMEKMGLSENDNLEQILAGVE